MFPCSHLLSGNVWRGFCGNLRIPDLFCQVLPGSYCYRGVYGRLSPELRVKCVPEAEVSYFTIPADDRSACLEDTGQLAVHQTTCVFIFPCKNSSALRAYIHC